MGIFITQAAMSSPRVSTSVTAPTPSPDLLDQVLVTQETLTVEDFIKITVHPRQRDTERRLAKALKNHLSQPSPVHQRVNIAVFNGERFKLDGHTRALAWSLGKLKAPKNLKADIYHCNTQAILLELYNHFDNKSAVETTPDILSGALRQAGLEVKSEVLKRYSFATALQVASRAFGVEECTNPYVNVLEFAEELKKLDSIDPTHSTFRVGVIAGAIILLRKHGDKILPFLQAYNENAGVKSTTDCDAAYALYDIATRGGKGRSGFSRTLELAGKTLSCGDRYLAGERYAVTKTGVTVKISKIAGYLKGRKLDRKES